MQPKQHELLVSVSPHVRSDESVSKIMWTVSIALLPAFFGGVYFFGMSAFIVTAVAIASAMIFESFSAKLCGREKTLSDGSAFLTGLLLGMNLPPTAPLYIPVIGALVAVVITKQLFGGLGFNIFNPALVGRAFVLITWPRAMTTWAAPKVAMASHADAVTTATPLGLLKEEGLTKLVEHFGGSLDGVYKALFFGNTGGSLGETSALLLLIGAAYLLYKRYITWHIPVSFLATIALIAWIAGGKGADGHVALFTGNPIIHVLSGGAILGAFFMATDYVTVPSVRAGQIVFGIGCGAITMLIRLKGGFPEGVMFAILLMNCFAPLIDRGMRPKVFGARKKG